MLEVSDSVFLQVLFTSHIPLAFKVKQISQKYMPAPTSFEAKTKINIKTNICLYLP